MPAGQQRAIKRSPESPTPVTDQRMHKHLRRLERVWIDWPIYVITTCTFNRRAIVASKEVVTTLINEWRDARGRHGWAVGRYVIMPDHIHFIIHLEGNVDKPATLAQVVGSYKSIAVVSWLHYIETNKIYAHGRFWQNYYYDRIIRNDEELEYTRQYIRPTKTTHNIPEGKNHHGTEQP